MRWLKMAGSLDHHVVDGAQARQIPLRASQDQGPLHHLQAAVECSKLHSFTSGGMSGSCTILLPSLSVSSNPKLPSTSRSPFSLCPICYVLPPTLCPLRRLNIYNFCLQPSVPSKSRLPISREVSTESEGYTYTNIPQRSCI